MSWCLMTANHSCVLVSGTPFKVASLRGIIMIADSESVNVCNHCQTNLKKHSIGESEIATMTSDVLVK